MHRLWKERHKLPDDWKFEPLQNLLKSMDAGSSPLCDAEPAKPGQWGVVKVSAVSWDHFDDQENKSLPPTVEPNSAEQIRVGDVIASRANTTELCGAVQRVERLYTHLLLCDKTWRLNPTDQVDSEWLVSALKLANSRRQIQALATGTSDSMKNISKRDFLNVRVPVPTLCEQRRIAAVLKLADEAIQKTRLELKAATAVKRSLEVGLLSGEIGERSQNGPAAKTGAFPQGWSIIPLKNLATVGSGITLNQDRAPKENACRYLTVAHVRRGSISIDDPRYLELSTDERRSRLLTSDDVLVVEGHANPMEIGRAAMFQDTGEATTFQNHLFRVRADRTQVLPKFLLYVLNSERVQRHWNAVCNTSSGLNTINRRSLRNVLIQCPGIDEQQEIVNTLDLAQQSVEWLLQRLDAEEVARRSLLQSLLTGEVRIPEGAIHA